METLSNTPARLEPTVEDFFDSSENTLTLLGRDSDVVYVLTMQVDNASFA